MLKNAPPPPADSLLQKAELAPIGGEVAKVGAVLLKAGAFDTCHAAQVVMMRCSSFGLVPNLAVAALCPAWAQVGTGKAAHPFQTQG
jgi:hypothetical protein